MFLQFQRYLSHLHDKIPQRYKDKGNLSCGSFRARGYRFVNAMCSVHNILLANDILRMLLFFFFF